MTKWDELKEMTPEQAAVVFSALVDACRDVARYCDVTVPQLVKEILESEA